MRLTHDGQQTHGQVTSFFGQSSTQSMSRVGTTNPQQMRVDNVDVMSSSQQSFKPQMAAQHHHLMSEQQMPQHDMFINRRQLSQAYESASVISPKQNYRNVSFNARAGLRVQENPFNEDTYSQLDYLMN